MSLVTCNESGETCTHKPAFRCKNCGNLVHAAHAGESKVPHACPVCKAGVEFVPSDVAARNAVVKEMVDAFGKDDAAFDAASKRLHNLPLTKKFVPENWEVLADCTPERLKELGLEPHHCERHVPHAKGESRPPQNHAVVAADGVGTGDSAAAK